MYKYKDCVHIPVLTFVDDALSVTECGPDSVKMNAYVQSKMDTKKFRSGVTPNKAYFKKKYEIICPAFCALIRTQWKH